MAAYRNQASPPPSTPGAYQNRYRRTAGSILERLFDAGPYILALASFIMAVVCLLALEGIDVIAGKYTAGYMSNPKFGWFFSSGTTGLSLAMIGTFFYGWRERWSWKLLVPLAVLTLIPMSIDILFDGMSVDIIRFGYFIDPSVQFAGQPVEILMHNLFRIFVGALSFIGEPLAAGSVVIFAMMREIFRGAVA